MAAPIVFNPPTNRRAITAPANPPALKLASRRGWMFASDSKADEEKTSNARPATRTTGALIRRARNLRHAAAIIRKGSRYAANPIDWNKAAATFAPMVPIQLRAAVSPAAFQDGSFGLYEARQSP